MNVLSLDLSSKSSGYAVFDNGTLIDSGVLTATSTDLIKRIQKITKDIKNVINNNHIDIVVLEEVLPSVGHNSNTNVWKALTWLQASVVFMLHDDFPKLKREFLLPNSWRAKIGIHTGKNARREHLKSADILYVKDHFNKIVGDDEADAICLGCAYYISNDELNWE